MAKPVPRRNSNLLFLIPASRTTMFIISVVSSSGRLWLQPVSPKSVHWEMTFPPSETHQSDGPAHVLAEGAEAEGGATDGRRQSAIFLFQQKVWCVGATPPWIICGLQLSHTITEIIKCISGFRKIAKSPFLWMISLHPVMSVETFQKYFEAAEDICTEVQIYPDIT